MGPRKASMNPLEIESHHTWSRCVRRTFLMGQDPLTGLDYSHRRDWAFSLQEYLASVVSVDLGGLNLLSNHLHHNSRSRPDLVVRMTDEDVVWRNRLAWPAYDKDRLWFCEPTDSELQWMLCRAKEDPSYIERLRRNLSDISFLMARLKEPIAKMANREERPRRTGHFWDGPYGNRKLETTEEHVVAFLYCDLQQLKAGMVDRLEDSDCSTIQAQIRAEAQKAFQLVHGRPPSGTDEDGEQLEQLEAMYANSWFAPITRDTPLITEANESPPKSELVLPAGYYFEQAQRAKAMVSKPSSQEASSQSADAGTTACDPPSPQPARRGRPRKVRPRTIHHRLKRTQRRRASDSSMLGLNWEEYSPVIYSIAERLLSDRRTHFTRPDPPDPEQPLGTPSSEAPDATAARFCQGFNNFAAWLVARSADAFGEMLHLLATKPRPPTQLGG